MKVLSLKQPYVELILNGKKKIELRKWNTNFRGKFLIHSSKIPDKESMKKFGFSDLPYGFILGEAEIVKVKHYANNKEHKKDKDLHLADSSWGNYGFVIKNPKKIKPIKANGKLGFWEYNQNNEKGYK